MNVGDEGRMSRAEVEPSFTRSEDFWNISLHGDGLDKRNGLAEEQKNRQHRKPMAIKS